MSGRLTGSGAGGPVAQRGGAAVPGAAQVPVPADRERGLRRAPGPPPGEAYPRLSPGRTAAQLVGGGLALALVLGLVGLALTRVRALAWVTDWEQEVSRWFVAHGSATWDTVTGVGSRMAETTTCIVLLVVSMVVLRWWLRRWRESLALLTALAGELAIFVAVSALVARDRPEVRHLDAAPPTSSFPSGHTGAAVALYGGLAVVLLRQLPWRRLAAALAAVLLLIPVFVGLSRLYRGMHQVTDVLFGAVNGAVWLAIVVAVLLPVVRRSPRAVTGAAQGRLQGSGVDLPGPPTGAR